MSGTETRETKIPELAAVKLIPEVWSGRSKWRQDFEKARMAKPLKTDGTLSGWVWPCSCAI